jgi:hypothetical protein
MKKPTGKLVSLVADRFSAQAAALARIFADQMWAVLDGVFGNLWRRLDRHSPPLRRIWDLGTMVVKT